MRDKSYNIDELLVRILENRAGSEEILYFSKWIHTEKENQKYFEQFKKLWNSSNGRHADQETINAGLEDYRHFMESELQPRRSMRLGWKVASVAAMVFVVISLFFWLDKVQEDIPMTAESDIETFQTENIVLKMADSEEVSLLDDSLGITKGLVQINKINQREISYVLSDTFEIPDELELVYDQITVPVGERFSIRLSDGTKAWINSDSYLRYPAYFGKGKREVEAYGNVYFEVVRDTARPFVVVSQEMTTEVLGTSFEVNTYNDKGLISTTLVEGKVQVSVGNHSAVIKPDQQFIWDTTDKDFRVEKVDAHKKVKWKDDILVIDNEYFDDVLRKMERWYGVSIVNETGVSFNQSFKGEFDREDIQAAIETICLNLNISYTIVGGNKIILKK